MSIVSESFLCQLDNFRNEKKYCDITLSVEGKKFHSHRIILAATIKYFDVLFDGNLKEKNKSEIVLNNVNANGFKALLDYVYTGRVELTEAMVQDILSVAVYFGVDCLTRKCVNYIKQRVINMHNVLQYHQFADSIGCDPLKAYTGPLIKNYFRDNVITESVSNMMLSVLKKSVTPADYDNVRKQFESLFENIGKINVDSSVSDSTYDEINENIYILGHGKSVKEGCMMKILRVKDFCVEEIPEMQVIVASSFKAVVSNGEVYVLADKFCCFRNGNWVDLTRTNRQEEIVFVASLDFYNSIYINKSYHCSDPILYYYKTDLDKWCISEIFGYVSSSEPFYTASLVPYENFIFSCGGSNVIGKAIPDVLLMDPRASKWIPKSPMLHADYIASSTVWNDKIYVDTYIYGFIQVYDIRADKWSQSTMKSGYKHLFTYRNKLHAIDYRSALNVFDSESNTWLRGPNFASFYGFPYPQLIPLVF